MTLPRKIKAIWFGKNKYQQGKIEAKLEKEDIFGIFVNVRRDFVKIKPKFLNLGKSKQNLLWAGLV